MPVTPIDTDQIVITASRAFDSQADTPFDVVRLKSYWLASARAAYAVRSGIELFARASNLFDERYEDAAGYRTEGRGLYLGIRLADRRSSP